MKNLILNGLFIVLICSLSARFGNASPVGDEYDDEYNYEEMYDYDDNSQNAGGDDYEVTSETSETESTKPPSTVRNETAVESSPKIVGIDEEPRTEPIRNVLIAETEILEDNDCPKGCTCDDQLQFINCSNRSLTAIPKNLPNTSLQIDLGYNNIKEIYDNDFSNLTVVREIKLNNNDIQTISGSVFQSLDRLDSMDLSSNNISKIDPDLFVHAQGLSSLTLNGNPITFEVNRTFLNLTNLEILNLVGCNVTQLYNETFTNLTGLSSLNLANNSFVEDINVDAFNPLTSLLKLKIPHVSKTATYGLCEKISVIDVISFDSYNISCYELISGSTYDESTITHGPTLQVENVTTPMLTTTTTQGSILVVTESSTTKSPRVKSIEIDDITPPSTESTPNNDALNKTGNGKDVKSEKVVISTEDIKTILIASIAIAVFGLIIGLICRKDVYGVKTKLCRTQRPEPPTMPEQVPLNKV